MIFQFEKTTQDFLNSLEPIFRDEIKRRIEVIECVTAHLRYKPDGVQIEYIITDMREKK
jgi:hypothetical protein